MKSKNIADKEKFKNEFVSTQRIELIRRKKFNYEVDSLRLFIRACCPMVAKSTFVLSALLPGFALGYVILVPLAIDFEAITRTHCYRTKNVLPSVSAAIGFSFQTYATWLFCIIFHTPFRYNLARRVYEFYGKVLSKIYSSDNLIDLSIVEIRKYKSIKRISAISYYLNMLEIFGLLILTLFPSYGNFEMHKNGFGMYLIGASGFTLCICLVDSHIKEKNLSNGYFKEAMHTSFNIRKKLAITFFSSLVASIIFYIWHNAYCTSYVYSCFGFFEIILILSNIAFHTYPSYLMIRNGDVSQAIV